MKKLTKVLAVVLCAALLVAGSVLGTLAYLTSQDEAVNTFTVGKVKIELDEAKINADGKPIDAEEKEVTDLSEAERVEENIYHLLPGHSYTKDPTVTVLKGSEDCYVRMFVTITKSAEWDQICDNHENTFGAAQMFTGLSSKWELKSAVENRAGENTRTYEFWYAVKVTDVPKDEDKTLDALFTGIEMPDALTNADLVLLGDDFKIYVIAQAIQADGFSNNMALAFEKAPKLEGSDLMPSVTPDATT